MFYYLKNNFLISAIIFLLAGFLLGSYAGYNFKKSITQETFIPLRSPTKEFPLINPLIGFDLSQSQSFSEFNKLKSRLNQFIDDQKINGHLLKIGVYLRTLQNGHWVGINENLTFNPGSLLKVPIMIAFLKQSELYPDILTKKIYYNSKISENSPAVPNPLKSKLMSGHTYTIDELIRAMIAESDNAAKDLLLDNIDKKYLNEVFYDFGINFIDTYEYTISIKTYALFLRRLYNATYLNRELSERALGLLSNSEYKKGLVAGTPEGISVAHKYGERGIYEGNLIEGLELHDCGIVYYPQNPMLICIMTEGNNSKKDLEYGISNITKIVSSAVKNKEF